MRRALVFPLVLLALHVQQATAVHAQACVADQHGGLVCGEGKAAMRVVADTISPAKDYAFAWRSAQGLPSGSDIPDDIENVLIRISDGAVLAKLAGKYWATGAMRANRYELIAAWSPDSRSVIEVANSRWESDSFAYYRIDGGTATKLDLRALVEPVMTARLPPRNRQGNSFRVRTDQPVTLDARGRLRFTAMLHVPKSETSNDYKVHVNVRTTGGKPSAQVVSMRRVKAD
ncbi:hypothetical protein ACH79_31470 [Bradyrhizobium sp. CCBAU 051011]|uniref:hypothetical protein n=1 Tax=Bradyrhizobium sp. CCBAU 051011 TaxID=858422 RepID=UPI001373CDBA|nr:hypothetical protein [Bradyrhizobium sp. CCBAU 051011]QHO76469.1 hypothetical protein ACH79_31470 [Bradyrhizobium sp. CCBAU 051011]